MADKPSDGTPDTGTAPPPRRRTRGEPVAAKSSRAKPAATRSPKRKAPAKKAAAAKATVAVAKPAPTPKKPRATKPKAPAASKSTAVSAPMAAARKFGIGKIVAIGAAAVAAGVAAILGRKKIATVSSDTIDAVIGKSEAAPATPEEKDRKSAD